MRVTAWPTGRFEQFEGIECRMWEGTTESGVRMEFFVPCVRVKKDQDQTEFLRDLREVKAERQLVSFDTRLV